MRIHVGYESKPMRKFNFLHQYHLRPYRGGKEPIVMFGCYKSPDIRLVRTHRKTVVLYWCGNDSLKADLNLVDRANIIHVTNLPPVRDYLRDKGLKIHLIKVAPREVPKPLVRGDKVYTYLNKGKPEYHGRDLIRQLKIPYQILIGDNSVSSVDWYGGEADRWYGQCFVGLFLSGYAGGGTSIMEMGLRGIRCVTNVLDMPHTIRWETLQDVEKSVEKESQMIGVADPALAQQVYEWMVPVNCFDLDKLIIE